MATGELQASPTEREGSRSNRARKSEIIGDVIGSARNAATCSACDNEEMDAMQRSIHSWRSGTGEGSGAHNASAIENKLDMLDSCLQEIRTPSG